MAESTATQTPEAFAPQEEKKANFVKRSIAKHPRIARAAGLTALVVAVAGVVTAVRNNKTEEDNSLPLELTASDVQDVTAPTTETLTVTEV